jgi:FMN phosphatase YigB (HAD superfamily)
LLTLDRLGAEAGRTAFLDDLIANVEAARRLGIHGVHVGEDQTEAIATTRELAGIG